MNLLQATVETANDINADPGFWADMASTKGIAVVGIVAAVAITIWIVKAKFIKPKDIAPSLIIACGLLALSGCVGADKAYVEADRATYEVIGEAHKGYVANDPTLAPEQKAIRIGVVDTWRVRTETNGGK